MKTERYWAIKFYGEKLFICTFKKHIMYCLL